MRAVDPAIPRNPVSRFRESVLKRYWKRTRRNNVVVIHAGRCGSTVLCDLLGQSRRIHNAGEVFNPANEQRMKLLRELGDPIRILEHEMRPIDRKYFLFATKPFREETQEALTGEVPQYLRRLRDVGFRRFIVLERRNDLRRRVSGLVAFKTRVWHSTVRPDQPQRVCFPEEDIVALPSRIAAVQREHREMRSLLGEKHRLDLFYEDDIESDPVRAYSKVCEFLRVTPFQPKLGWCAPTRSPCGTSSRISTRSPQPSPGRRTSGCWRLDGPRRDSAVPARRARPLDAGPLAFPRFLTFPRFPGIPRPPFSSGAAPPSLWPFAFLTPERLRRSPKASHAKRAVAHRGGAMKIVLADTHGPVLGKDQGTPNLSILYLASYLREHVPDIEVHYIPQKYDFAHHAKMIEEIQPDFYGASFTSYGAPVTYKLINELKARFPQLRVICGGAHTSAAPQDVLEKSATDICVVGEGEKTLLEIVTQEDYPYGLQDIRGIAYRTGDGRLRHTPPRPLMDNIDDVPHPSRDLVNDRDYAGLSHRKARPNAEMIVTRGCPYRCVFCANPVFRGEGPKYRGRSPQSIAEEAEQLYQLGYREIYLHSDELNVRLDWSIEVCQALAALGHRDLYFQTNLRVTPMSENFAYWLKEANFWMVRFGIESASQRVLVGIKKKMSRLQTEHACELVARQGIKVYGYFMMFQFWERDGEFQYETAEEGWRAFDSPVGCGYGVICITRAGCTRCRCTARSSTTSRFGAA